MTATIIIIIMIDKNNFIAFTTYFYYVELKINFNAFNFISNLDYIKNLQMPLSFIFIVNDKMTMLTCFILFNFISINNCFIKSINAVIIIISK